MINLILAGQAQAAAVCMLHIASYACSWYLMPVPQVTGPVLFMACRTPFVACESESDTVPCNWPIAMHGAIWHLCEAGL